jgi:hypothetical protein
VTPTAGPASFAAAWALLGGLATLVAWLGWHSRGWPLIHDAPIMHYIAWRIGQGDAPYRDLLDMNFPGVYLLHGALLWLAGAGDVAWRVFDLAFLAAGCLAVAVFAAPWGWVAAVGGGLFFALYHLAAGPWQAGQRDFLLCPFVIAGALGVARWMERRASPAPLLWAGLALGAGLTIKPHAAVLGVAFSMLVARAAWRAGGGLADIQAVAIYVLGVVAPVIITVSWVAGLGALPAWRALLADYLLPLYSRLHQADAGLDRWYAWLPVGAGIGLSAATALEARRFGIRHRIALLGLASGLIHFFVQGKGWEYHLYPAAAFAAVLLFSELEPLVRARAWPAVPLAASLILAVALLGSKGAGSAAAAESGWVSAKARRVSAVVEALKRYLEPGDRVQVLDTTDGGIHALLRLGIAQPTRFLYDFHFFHDTGTPVVRALRRELLRGLERRPPRCVVFFAGGWPTGGWERLSSFPELQRLLAARYREAVRGDGFIVYAKRDGT